MRSKETLKRIIRQIISGVVATISGMICLITDTKGYLGISGVVLLFCAVGGALSAVDGLVDIIGEIKNDPDYRRRWWNIDEEP